MKRVRNRLERELTRVTDHLRRLHGGATEAEPGDATGLAGDEIDLVQTDQRREISLLTRSHLMERAVRLSAALDRIARGTYGVCMECGKPIHRGRLAALPEADTCVACQEQRERSTVRRRVA